jgi:lipoprotein-anchoring transpeptidase ErfK/SrfK
MLTLNRRVLLVGAATSAAASLAGCASTSQNQIVATTAAPPPPTEPAPDVVAEAPVPGKFSALYGPVTGEPFPVPGLRPSDIDPAFVRKAVDYASREPAGTIVIDPHSHFLYFVEANGRAMRYGVGVGREGFAWSGTATINSKQEWPDWYPPKEMIERQPELRPKLAELQSGIGMHGGPHNPLGARAMYLWQDNKDTLFRIHGTTEPRSIGKSVSSGCIRMVNQDVIDLYSRVAVGSRVVVIPAVTARAG